MESSGWDYFLRVENYHENELDIISAEAPLKAQVWFIVMKDQHSYYCWEWALILVWLFLGREGFPTGVSWKIRIAAPTKTWVVHSHQRVSQWVSSFHNHVLKKFLTWCLISVSLLHIRYCIWTVGISFLIRQGIILVLLCEKLGKTRIFKVDWVRCSQ